MSPRLLKPSTVRSAPLVSRCLPSLVLPPAVRPPSLPDRRGRPLAFGGGRRHHEGRLVLPVRSLPTRGGQIRVGQLLVAVGVRHFPDPFELVKFLECRSDFAFTQCLGHFL